MRYMFYEASSFDQPIGSWNVSRVTDMCGMFSGVTLSTPNYDNLLLGWSNLSLQHNVTFYAGNYSKYSNNSVKARQFIITNFNWTIIDGGLLENSSPIISSYILVITIAALGITIVIVILKKHKIISQF